MSRSRPISVGIVGAGFAGLRCADVLIKHGVKVTIFEARDRLGGRVAQSNHLGAAVDLGANWIHGTRDNPILGIAHQTNTVLSGLSEESILYDSKGKELDPEEVGELARLQWDDGFIADAFKYSRENGENIDVNRSLKDFFEEKVNKLFTDLPDDAARTKRERFLQYASLWGAYIGSDWARQSLRFFWLEQTIEGENPFVAGTYAKILEAVATPAVKGATIHLESAVTAIHHVERSSNAKPSLQISNGTTHEFDEVIVTAPLGWLKNNKTVFEPELSPRLLQAIDDIGYGNLDKVLITFPSAFWQTQSAESQASSQHNHKTLETPNVRNAAAPLNQPEPGSQDSSAGFIQWLAPSYASDTNPESWCQQGMNLAALPTDCAHPTLLFYIYGDCGRHIGSIVKNSASVAAADEALIDFFKPYFARLPNYNAGSPDCKPKAVLATAWVNDEYAGFGSYTNCQIGLEKADQDIEVMRHGMPERGLWLAGEHTAPFIAMGTTTGAYWSGEHVAERVLKSHGLEETT